MSASLAGALVLGLSLAAVVLFSAANRFEQLLDRDRRSVPVEEHILADR